MVKSNIYDQTEIRKIVSNLGSFSVLEYQKDISVTPASAQTAFFASQMGTRKRQVIASLNNSGVYIQAGAMQWFSGNIEVKTGVTGVGNFFKKAISSAVTGETAIKPVYNGTGTLVLEPTYKHILLENIAEWGGGIVIDDGLFLAADSSVDISVTARSNLSSAIAGGEGLFNTLLKGNGTAVLESPVPREELIEIEVQNDTVKIDGNMAVAWSPSLQFTVEKTTKTLIGSAASGEGLVNVYRGTGKILMAPIM